jgi:exopolysaccharide production protein ExoZ
VTTAGRHQSLLQKWKHKLASWYETDFGPSRIMPMEGLRGLAIALVFLCHFQIIILSRLTESFNSRFFLVVAQIGGTGVDLFFVLSGMLIYRAALKPGMRYSKFLFRRVERIFPTFVVVLALYIVVLEITHTGAHSIAVGFRALAISSVEDLRLLPGIINLPAIISAAWSLSYEFAFYLAIPILVVALRARLWSRRSRALFWAALIPAYLLLVHSFPGWFPSFEHFDGSYVRFTLFLAGMVVEEILTSSRPERFLTRPVEWLLLLTAALASGALVLSEYMTVGSPIHDSSQHAAVRAALLVATYASLALLTLRSGSLLSRIFCYTPLRWTGNISYSFYLIHGFVLNAVALVVGHLTWAKTNPRLAAPLLFVLAGAATYATATGLFLVIEKPWSLRPRSKRAPSPKREAALVQTERAS